MGVFYPPEEQALRRLLGLHAFDAAGTAVRLAWLAGLTRSELLGLTWERVSFLNQEMTLPGRTVPLCGELETYLKALSARQPWQAKAVVLSDRDQRPPRPEPLSQLVRRALDEVGQTRVRLLDLRYDYMRRQLETHDWQFVSRTAGIGVETLRAHLAPHLPEAALSARASHRGGQPEAEALRQLLQDEGDTPAARAIWLVWQAGLSLAEVSALRWEQVSRRELRTAAGAAAISEELAAFLLPLRGDPAEPVVRAVRSKNPIAPERISRLAKAALVRAGLDNTTLSDLRKEPDADGELARLARENGSITRREAETRLGVSKTAAYGRLRRLTERGELMRVGARYYPADAVVPPERQYEAIRAYLETEGLAYRQDIARLLRVDARQCTVILRRLMQQGKLCRDKQKYYLRDA